MIVAWKSSWFTVRGTWSGKAIHTLMFCHMEDAQLAVIEIEKLYPDHRAKAREIPKLITEYKKMQVQTREKKWLGIIETCIAG